MTANKKKKMKRNEIEPSSDSLIDNDLTFEDALEKYPFLVIIARYDDHLGPITLYSSFAMRDENLLTTIVRTTLTADSKTIVFELDGYDFLKIQGWNIEIPSERSRGGTQLFSIILLRSKSHLDLIPPSHFLRMDEKFRLIGNDNILSNNIQSFKHFVDNINQLYFDKYRFNDALPLENMYKNIREHINYIQGLSGLNKDQVDNLSKDDLIVFFDDIIDSCTKIMNALEKPISILNS